MTPLALLFLTVGSVLTASIGTRLIATYNGQPARPVFDIEVWVVVVAWAMFGYLTLTHP